MPLVGGSVLQLYRSYVVRSTIGLLSASYASCCDAVVNAMRVIVWNVDSDIFSRSVQVC